VKGPSERGARSGRGFALVVSGPSGSGKSTICRRLLEDPRVTFSVSATTRPMRPGEVDGKDYHFVDKARFKGLIEQGAFLEWAEVHGNLYGTLRSQVLEALERGQIVLVEIDVQGGAQLKAIDYFPGTYVFIAPPDMPTLERRLAGRGTDAPDVVERRMRKAREEMLAQDKYDHVVVNDDLERARAVVRRIAGLEPRGSTARAPREPGESHGEDQR
jgi:guanylate kinase